MERGSLLGQLSQSDTTLKLPARKSGLLHFSVAAASGTPCGISWSQEIDPGSENVVVRQPWREDPRAAMQCHVLAWSVAEDASVMSEVSGKPISALSPVWWRIGDDGTLSSFCNPGLSNLLEEQAVVIWPALQGLSANGLHLALRDDRAMLALAGRISEEARRNSASGLNIDLEGYREVDSEAVAVFVELLAGLVREWGGVVSIDLVPRGDRWEVRPADLAFWSTAPRRRRLAAACDYTVLMAYDEHSGRRPAGPVASLAWIEDMLSYQLRYSDPHRTILGIPSYGLLWRPDQPSSPRALPLNRLRVGSGPSFHDAVHGMLRGVRADGNFFWSEFDIAAERIDIANRFGLAGVAVWRLGLDYARLWQDIGERIRR